jgi:hypothetical protein
MFQARFGDAYDFLKAIELIPKSTKTLTFFVN